MCPSDHLRINMGVEMFLGEKDRIFNECRSNIVYFVFLIFSLAIVISLECGLMLNLASEGDQKVLRVSYKG